MSIPADLKKELEEAFFFFAYDKDRKISNKEVGAVVRSVGLNPTEAQLKEMMNEVDRAGGRVDVPTMARILQGRMKEQTTSHDELRDAFQVFDKNGNGLVSVHDLKHSLTTLGERLADEELDELVREVDTDGEGQLNYEDVVKVLLGK
ncbi:putative calmodulin-3 [Lamellibrachia satsuma]|nr:putative calmodulin-3 [Lamellibrachia satsuma]